MGIISNIREPQKNIHYRFLFSCLISKWCEFRVLNAELPETYLQLTGFNHPYIEPQAGFVLRWTFPKGGRFCWNIIF